MSEIRPYRGKSTLTGQWAFGDAIKNYPLKVWDGCCIKCITYEVAIYDGKEFIEVIPETAGQFTGLSDRNGKKIYEGDIVKFVGGTCDFLSCGNYASDIHKKGTVLVVKHLKSGYTLQKVNHIGIDTPNMVGNVNNYDFWNHQRSFVVIGTVVDNPELLEVTNETEKI